jgi:hypothetical protein
VLLETGHDYFGDFPSGLPSQDELRDAWADLADSILPEYIQRLPGCRPAGWWRFDAPPELGGDHPLLAQQPAILAQHGLLGEQEQRQLAEQDKVRRAAIEANCRKRRNEAAKTETQ